MSEQSKCRDVQRETTSRRPIKSAALGGLDVIAVPNFFRVSSIFSLLLLSPLLFNRPNCTSDDSLVIHEFSFSLVSLLFPPLGIYPNFKMQSPNDSKPQDLDTKSILSMQELDPSPVDDDSIPDLESGEYFPGVEEDKPKRACGFPTPKLGLRAHRWDALCMLIKSRETFQMLTEFK